MQRLDLGRGEAERVDERLGAQTVTSDEDQRDSPLLAGLRERAREVGDDESVVALGRARERDGAALLEAAKGGRREGSRRLVGALWRFARAIRTGERTAESGIRAAAPRRR